LYGDPFLSYIKKIIYIVNIKIILFLYI
jgi:hypothetical protein